MKSMTDSAEKRERGGPSFWLRGGVDKDAKKTGAPNWQRFTTTEIPGQLRTIELMTMTTSKDNGGDDDDDDDDLHI